MTTELVVKLDTIKQGSQPTVTFIWPLPSSHAPTNFTGATLSGTMRRNLTGAVTAISDGSLSVVDGPTREIGWAFSEEDSGTDGTFALSFRAVIAGKPIYTLNGLLVIEPNPDVDTVAGAALVGVTTSEAAWVTAAKTAVPSGTDVVGEAPSDGNQYARQDGDWEEINVVSDVGGLTTTGLTTANMLRIKSGGGIEERTPAQVLSDISAVGTSALSAAPTAAEPLKADGSGGIRFSSKLSVGDTPTADDTLFNAKRSIVGAINSHAFRDESAHSPASGVGYGAFDSAFSISGNTALDHISSFQDRPTFSGGGTLTEHRGFWSNLTHNGVATITRVKQFVSTNPGGAGPIGTLYGHYFEELTRGTTNYAIFTAGATPSYFGGLVQAGSNFRVDGLASFGNVAANTAYQVYIAANLDATKVAGMAALAVSPINVSTGNSYGLFFSNAAQNNTLASIGTNYTYGMSGLAACYATSANSAARGIYGARFGTLFSANTGYTATAIYAYAITIDTFAATGAGTISIGEVVGVNIENQGSSKAPTSHGLRIKAQSGSSASYSLYTEAGTVRLMASAADKIGFHGATPVAQQLLATGAGATVDNVITALQTLGLLRQS